MYYNGCFFTKNPSQALSGKTIAGSVALGEMGLGIGMQLLLNLPCFQAKTNCFPWEWKVAYGQKNSTSKICQTKSPLQMWYDRLRIQIAPAES